MVLTFSSSSSFLFLLPFFYEERSSELKDCLDDDDDNEMEAKGAIRAFCPVASKSLVAISGGTNNRVGIFCGITQNRLIASDFR